MPKRRVRATSRQFDMRGRGSERTDAVSWGSTPSRGGSFSSRPFRLLKGFALSQIRVLVGSRICTPLRLRGFVFLCVRVVFEGLWVSGPRAAVFADQSFSQALNSSFSPVASMRTKLWASEKVLVVAVAGLYRMTGDCSFPGVALDCRVGASCAGRCEPSDGRVRWLEAGRGA